MPSVLGHGDHPVGLDVDVLLVAGAVFALDDHVGPRPAPPATSPLRMVISLKTRGERSGSKTGSPGSISTVAGTAQSALAVLVGQQQHRLLGVADLARRPGRAGRPRSCATAFLPGMSRWSTTTSPSGSGGEVHPQQPAAGPRRPDGAAVEHAREGQVVDVPGVAVDLGGRLLPDDVPSHAAPLHTTPIVTPPRRGVIWHPDGLDPRKFWVGRVL